MMCLHNNNIREKNGMKKEYELFREKKRKNKYREEIKGKNTQEESKKTDRVKEKRIIVDRYKTKPMKIDEFNREKEISIVEYKGKENNKENKEEKELKREVMTEEKISENRERRNEEEEVEKMEIEEEEQEGEIIEKEEDEGIIGSEILALIYQDKEMNDKEMEEMATNLLEWEIIITKERAYYWDYDKMLWIDMQEDANKRIRTIIQKYCEKYNIKCNITDIMIKKLILKLTDNKIEYKMNGKKYCLPIKKGKLLDLRTLQIRQRCKYDLFTFELNVNFTPHKNELFDNWILDICHNKPLIVQQLQSFLAYYLTGYNYDKNCYQILGSPQTRTHLINLIKYIWGSYCIDYAYSPPSEDLSQKRMIILHDGFDTKLKSHNPNSKAYLPRQWKCLISSPSRFSYYQPKILQFSSSSLPFTSLIPLIDYFFSWACKGCSSWINNSPKF